MKNYLINGGFNFWSALGPTIGAAVVAVTTTDAQTTATVASTAALRPGMSIKSTAIPAGTTIASITNATTFELSAAATATGANNASVGIADDQYTADQWIVLHNGDAPVVVSRSTTVPTGLEAVNSLKVVVTANGAAKQFALCQVLENRTTETLLLKKLGLSFVIRSSATALLSKVRAAIIGWAHTADAVTSDVVATWAGNGTAPTLAANWSYLSDVVDCELSQFWSKRFVATTEAVSSSVNNIAVLIWLDDVNAAALDEIYITNAMLTEGDVAPTDFELAGGDIESEEALCNRYFVKSFKRDTAPGIAVGEANNPGAVSYYAHTAANKKNASPVFFPVPMRTEAPTITLYSPVLYTAKWYNVTQTADSGTAAAEHKTSLGFSVANPQVAGDAAQDEMVVHFTADARL